MWNEKLNRKLKAVTTLVDSYAFWLVGIYVSYVVARLQFISFLLLLSMNSASITSANPCVHYDEMSLEQPPSGLTSIAQPRRHGFAPFQVEGHAEMLLLYATEVLRYFSLEF